MRKARQGNELSNFGFELMLRPSVRMLVPFHARRALCGQVESVGHGSVKGSIH